MAPRLQYIEDLRTDPGAVLRSTADGNQDIAIANLTRHIQILWNHVERLEKLLAVGKSNAAPEPSTQGINIRSVRDGSIKTNSLTLEAARNISIKASTNASLKALKGMEVTCDGSVRVAAGKKLAITSSEDITMSCGAASLTLKKDGNIILRGKDVTLDGTGRISVKAAADLTLKGSKVNQN